MKRKIALAMVLAMTASMAQPVLAADSKTTLVYLIQFWKQYLIKLEIHHIEPI